MTGGRHMARNVSYSPWIASSLIAIGSIPVIRAILLPALLSIPITNHPSEYGGRHLIYLGNYRSMDDPLFKMPKEEILQEFLPHLKRINSAFEPEWIQESWLFQAPFAQPIVTTDYREHIPPLRTPLKGLWVANMFQVYPHDRGQNYSFELADRLVRELNPIKSRVLRDRRPKRRVDAPQPLVYRLYTKEQGS